MRKWPCQRLTRNRPDRAPAARKATPGMAPNARSKVPPTHLGGNSATCKGNSVNNSAPRSHCHLSHCQVRASDLAEARPWHRPLTLQSCRNLDPSQVCSRILKSKVADQGHRPWSASCIIAFERNCCALALLQSTWITWPDQDHFCRQHGRSSIDSGGCRARIAVNLIE